MLLVQIANVLAWGPITVRGGRMAGGMKSVTHSLFYGVCNVIQFVCLQPLTRRSSRPACGGRLSLFVNGCLLWVESRLSNRAMLLATTPRAQASRVIKIKNQISGGCLSGTTKECSEFCGAPHRRASQVARSAAQGRR